MMDVERAASFGPTASEKIRSPSSKALSCNEDPDVELDSKDKLVDYEGPTHTGNVLLKIGSYFLFSALFKNIGWFNVVLALTPYNHAILGLNNLRATQVTAIFMAVKEALPIIGSSLADNRFGRYKVMIFSMVVWTIGSFVLAIGTFARWKWLIYFGLFTLYSIGAGWAKPTFVVLGADQFRTDDPYQVRQKESYFSYFYWIANVSSFIVGIFFLDFSAKGWGIVPANQSYAWGMLISAVFLAIATAAVILPSNKYYKPPPKASVASNVLRICWDATKLTSSGKFWTTACLFLCLGFFLGIPAQIVSQDWLTYIAAAAIMFGVLYHVLFSSNVEWVDSAGINEGERSWTQQEVQDAKDMVRIFPFVSGAIIFWAVYAQTTGNFLTQGCQMYNLVGGYPLTTQSISTFNPLIVVVLVPLMDHVVYPLIARSGYQFTTLQRIGTGMLFCCLAMVYTGFIEIARKNSALTDVANICNNNGNTVNALHILWTAPSYILLGIAEVFVSVTYYNFFFTEVNSTMRTTSTALMMMTQSLGFIVSGVLNEILSPWITDDLNDGHQEYVYYVIAVLAGIITILHVNAARTFEYREEREIEEKTEKIAEPTRLAPVEQTVVEDDVVTVTTNK